MTTERPPLPPNQALAAPGKWPVVGERAPGPGPDAWCVEVTGLVARPRSFTVEELRAQPWVERVLDIHCVTRWSRPGARFGGVLVAQILAECEPLPEARFVSFVARSDHRHSTSLPLADVLDLEALVALDHDGEALPSAHGGPVRTVVPGRYFYKSLKWLERVELLAEDRLGTWEAEAGYHNHGDPWAEERYIAGNLSRREVEELLAARDFSDRDLLGLAAAGHDLSGLKAKRARLRNADFRRADLRAADLREANLSNAHLQGADLTGADLRGADAEGAEFSGADLRGADLRGASLFGATLGPEEGAPGERARIDASTRLDEAALSTLTPWQRALAVSADP